jgi:hypothetical protein
MFIPVPAGSEPPPRLEPDPEPVAAMATWRPRGRWRALLRLSWFCRLLALVSAVVCTIWAVIQLIAAFQAESGAGVFAAFATLFSALVGWVIWMGLAELILLLIALERNSRQIRERLPKPPSDDSTVVQR